MSASDIPLDGQAILRHLEQVADLLPAGAPRREVLVVGGSWPACDFASAQEAVELHRAAYPHEALDPHLVDFVQGLGR